MPQDRPAAAHDIARVAGVDCACVLQPPLEAVGPPIRHLNPGSYTISQCFCPLKMLIIEVVGTLRRFSFLATLGASSLGSALDRSVPRAIVSDEIQMSLLRHLCSLQKVFCLQSESFYCLESCAVSLRLSEYPLCHVSHILDARVLQG